MQLIERQILFCLSCCPPSGGQIFDGYIAMFSTIVKNETLLLLTVCPSGKRSPSKMVYTPIVKESKVKKY